MAETSYEYPLLTPKPSDNRRLPKWSWATIIALAALGVGILVYRQGQRDYELLSAAPILRAEAVHMPPGERRGLPEAREEIIEEFFETMLRLSDENPGKSHVELIEMALPISRELNPAPIRVDVAIENIGTKVATNVICLSFLAG